MSKKIIRVVRQQPEEKSSSNAVADLLGDEDYLNLILKSSPTSSLNHQSDKKIKYVIKKNSTSSNYYSGNGFDTNSNVDKYQYFSNNSHNARLIFDFFKCCL